MDDKKKIKNRLFVILGLTLFLTVFVLFQTLVFPSLARYIKQEKDRLVARYTALYLTTNGEGKTISLEKKEDQSGGYEGYMSFDLMNYKDEDVTRRDITYSIDTLQSTKYYDENGELIDDPTKGNLHVLDLWGEPVKIGDDTYKYKVTVESVTEEGVPFANNNNYVFKYKKNGDQDIGIIHSLTIKVERLASFDATDDLDSIENISIIINISVPYKQVFIINVSLSNYLIMFSETDYSQFEMNFTRVYVQSANIYKYFKGTTTEKEFPYENPKYEISNRALKVTLYWDDNFRINLHDVDGLHIGIGSTSGDILITDPYVNENDIFRNSIVIYVPEGSDFYLEFYKYNSNIMSKIYANVQVLSGVIDSDESTFTYRDYDYLEFGAYDYAYVQDTQTSSGNKEINYMIIVDK